jgi:glycine cleavage system H protein
MAAIFMVLLFLSFLIMDIIVRKVQTQIATTPATSTTSIPFGLKVEDLALPGGLFFHKSHTWAGISTSGEIKLGVNDFMQNVLGRIDSIKALKIGDTINEGEKLFSVEQGKRKVEFHAPIDGVISSVNKEVLNNPSLIKENPYENGWVYSIKPTNLANDIKALSIADGAKKWLKSEVQRFKEFIGEQFVDDKMLGKTLADGGTIVDGIMEHMDDFSWMKLQEEFLSK